MSDRLIAVLTRIAHSLDAIVTDRRAEYSHIKAMQVRQRKVVKFWAAVAADTRYPNLRALVETACVNTDDVIDGLMACEDYIAVAHYICRPDNKDILVRFSTMEPDEVAAELKHIERRVRLAAVQS